MQPAQAAIYVALDAARETCYAARNQGWAEGGGPPLWQKAGLDSRCAGPTALIYTFFCIHLT